MMDVAIEKRSQLLPPDTQSLTNLLVAKLHGTSDVRYSGREWMIATEVELPTRDGGRVDVLAARKSWSNFELRAHEVKVSRSDFFADVNKGKYRRYLTSCHSVVFVTPKGLVKSSEVPDDAGLMTYDSEKATWRMAKKPPVRTGRPELLDERVVFALAMKVDSDLRLQIARLSTVDRQREEQRARFLGKQAARGRLSPDVLDDAALLEYAKSRAGWELARKIDGVDRKLKLANELVSALQAAGYTTTRSYGDQDLLLIEDFHGIVTHVMRVASHLRDLQRLAGVLNQSLMPYSSQFDDDALSTTVEKWSDALP